MGEAGLALGISNILGTLWWVITMLTYAPNSNYLRNEQHIAQEPIIWFWGNLGNSTMGWTAASYFATFIVYATVSVVELFGWSFWASKFEGSACFYKFYTSNIGYWLTLYGGIFTWLWGILQLVLPAESGGLAGNLAVEYSANAIFLIIGNGVMWITMSLLHIIFVPLLDDEIVSCDFDLAEEKRELERA